MLDTVEQLYAPRFTQPEVLRAAELKAATLQTWANRGLVQPANPSPGTGQRRRYSAVQVFKLRLMQTLATFGVSVARAAGIADEVSGKCGAGPIPFDSFTVIEPPRDNDVVQTHAAAGGYEGDPWEIRLAHILRRSANPNKFNESATGDPYGGTDAALVIHTGRVYRDVMAELKAILSDEQ